MAARGRVSITAAIAVGLSAALLSTPVAAEAGQSAGELDPTFGTGGKVELQLAPGVSTLGLGPVMQGNRIVVGSHTGGNDGRFAVTRFTRNGRVDASFGDGGTVEFGLPDLSLRAMAVGVQPNGRIVQSGYAFGDTGKVRLVVVRYTADGELDTTFGTDGVRLVGFPNTTYANPGNLAIDRRGRIVVTGYTGADCGSVSYEPQDCGFGVIRLTKRGQIDRSFGTHGRVVADFGDRQAQPRNVIVRGDGRIVVVGYRIDGAGANTGVMLGLTDDGELDSRFGRDGRVRYRIDDITTLSAVAEAPDRTLVVAASIGEEGSQDLAVFRLRPNGSLDTTFAGRGYVTREITATGSAGGRAVHVNADGSIIVVGMNYLDRQGSESEFVLARLRPNGAFDRTFGSGGVTTTSFGAQDNQPWGLAISGPSSIVVSGYANPGGPGNYSLVMAAYCTVSRADPGC